MSKFCYYINLNLLDKAEGKENVVHHPMKTGIASELWSIWQWVGRAEQNRWPLWQV